MSRLVDLYTQIADMTASKCAGKGARACNRPRSCCSPEYCAMTIEWAKSRHDVTLTETGHETLPLMGPAGCIAAPHLRPWCALHVCSLGLGIVGSESENDRYWKLRNEVSLLED